MTSKYEQQAKARKRKRKVYKLKKLRDQKIKGHMERSKEIGARNRADILKKEAEGGYKNTPLGKKPVGVAFREIFNKEPKLKQKKKKKAGKK